MGKDPHAQAEKVYRQILEMLEELSVIYADGDEREVDDEEGVPVDIDDVIDAIVEEATERGMDEEHTDRVFKSIAAFCKKTAEG